MEYKYRKYFGNTVLGLSGLVTVILVLVLLGGSLDDPTFLFLFTGFAVLGLFGFFSVLNYNNAKSLSKGGMFASIACAFVVFIGVVNTSLILDEAAVRLINFLIFTTFSLGYINLLMSTVKEGRDLRNKLITMTILSVFIFFIFSLISIYQPKNELVLAFISASFIPSFYGGLMVYTLSLIDHEAIDFQNLSLSYMIYFVLATVVSVFSIYWVYVSFVDVSSWVAYGQLQQFDISNFYLTGISFVFVLNLIAALLALKIKDKFPKTSAFGFWVAIVSIVLALVVLFLPSLKPLSGLANSLSFNTAICAILLGSLKEGNERLNKVIYAACIMVIALVIINQLFMSSSFSFQAVSSLNMSLGWPIRLFFVLMILICWACLYVFIVSRYPNASLAMLTVKDSDEIVGDERESNDDSEQDLGDQLDDDKL